MATIPGQQVTIPEAQPGQPAPTVVVVNQGGGGRYMEREVACCCCCPVPVGMNVIGFINFLNLYNFYNSMRLGALWGSAHWAGYIFMLFVILAWLPIFAMWFFLFQSYRRGPDEIETREQYVKVCKMAMLSYCIQLVSWPLFGLITVGQAGILLAVPALAIFGTLICCAACWLMSAKNYLIELHNKKNLSA